MNIKDSFHPYAITTIIFWSLAYVLTRLTLRYFTAFSLGFLRYLIASFTLLIVAVITKMKPPRRADLPKFIVSGAVGFFLYMIVFNQGQAAVTAATASLVIVTVPVITALIASFIYREKMRMYQWCATIIELIGVAVLTLMNGVFSINKGLFWLFLAVIGLSSYNLIQRYLTKTYTALQSTTYSIFLGTIMLAIFAPASFRELSGAPPIQYFYLAILGVGSGALAYVTWAAAFSKAKQTSQVSNYMFITPLLTSLLGFLIAGEVLDLSTIYGGIIIFTGVLIFNFGGRIFDKVDKHKEFSKHSGLKQSF